MFDWTDLESGFGILVDAWKIWSSINSANKQSDLDNSNAAARAIFTQESADLQAEFLRAQGDAAENVGEYNAEIYDTQAGIALDLANRDKHLIQDNADIQKGLDMRKYHNFLGAQVASVAGAGVTISGSAIDVMMDSASVMQYSLDVKKWATDVAVENRDVAGNLQNWEATVNAGRERYIGQLNKALKYKEADITEQLGALAAGEEAQ